MFQNWQTNTRSRNITVPITSNAIVNGSRAAPVVNYTNISYLYASGDTTLTGSLFVTNKSYFYNDIIGSTKLFIK